MAQMTDEEIADWIAAGREYIEKNGWWRGSLVGLNKKQACIVGGLMFSHGLIEGQEHYVTPVARKLVEHINSFDRARLYGSNTDVTYLMQWNDHKAKDKQEVLDLMAKTEKKLRAGFDPDEGIVP